MATPLSPARIAQALRAEGVQVIEYPGWATAVRPGAWGPVHGVVMHHTGPYSNLAGIVRLCREGRSDLPGPLCLGVIDTRGVVHLVGGGRANHAGKGDGDVLRAVVDERPLPRPDVDDTDGNARFYGFECANPGDGKPWPAAQLEAMGRAAAALCRAHGWSAGSVIAHREWTRRKVDPAGVDMPGFRRAVAALLAPTKPAPPQPTPAVQTPAPAPVPPAPAPALAGIDLGELMADINEVAAAVANGVWQKPYLEYGDADGDGTRDARPMADVLLNIERVLLAVAKKIGA